MTDQARALKEAREAKGWTQKKLSEAARVSVRTIRRIESGAKVSERTYLKFISRLADRVKAKPKVIDTGAQTSSNAGKEENVTMNETEVVTLKEVAMVVATSGARPVGVLKAVEDDVPYQMTEPVPQSWVGRPPPVP